MRKKRNKRETPFVVTILLVLAWSLLLFFAETACSQEATHKVSDGKEAVSPPQGSEANAERTEGQMPSEFVYDATGKTDPFKPFIAEQESAKEEKPRKPRTYLETVALSQLDLIAIILSPKGNWAMVRDAKGLGYVIKKGTPIGLNEGVVHEIREKEVIVRERQRNYRGKNSLEDVAMKLHSPM